MHVEDAGVLEHPDVARAEIITFLRSISMAQNHTLIACVQPVFGRGPAIPVLRNRFGRFQHPGASLRERLGAWRSESGGYRRNCEYQFCHVRKGLMGS
jgi:hypothetical protein